MTTLRSTIHVCWRLICWLIFGLICRIITLVPFCVVLRGDVRLAELTNSGVNTRTSNDKRKAIREKPFYTLMLDSNVSGRTEILLLHRLEIDVLILLSAKLMFKYTTEFDYVWKKVLRKVAGSRTLYTNVYLHWIFFYFGYVYMQPSATLFSSKVERHHAK